MKPKRKTRDARTPNKLASLQVRDFPPELPGNTWLTHAEVLQYVPVSRSQWFRGVKAGQFPKPHKIGRLAFWKARDIRRLLELGPRPARVPPPRTPVAPPAAAARPDIAPGH